MNDFIKKREEEFKGAIEHFKKELASIRAGRANPAMIENIMVESYGAKTPLKQLSSIMAQEARTMVVQPWDKSLLKEIEKAITYANLGLSVAVDSAVVRVNVPQMTEENRRDLVKLMNEKMEAAKVGVRSVREKVKEEIMTAFRASGITEDDKYKFVEELDKKVGELNKELQEIAGQKEKEIMNI